MQKLFLFNVDWHYHYSTVFVCFADKSIHRNHFRTGQWWRVQVFPSRRRPCSSNATPSCCRAEFPACGKITHWNVSLTFIFGNWGSFWREGLFACGKGSLVIPRWNSGISYITNETWLVGENCYYDQRFWYALFVIFAWKRRVINFNN